ncbi:MAG: alpha-amylase family glycosyl hydrolase [Ruminococcus sp.]|nr:alpha-amylase family glycosyl hydrolase [Ruminococcus sp.]
MKCKKLFSFLLVISLIMGCFAVNISSTAAETDSPSEEETVTDYGLLDTPSGGAILHCFNWSYNNIKAKLKDIAEAGYTSVQTSPVQRPKDYNSGWTDLDGQWWKMYQPLSLSIAESGSWLGTKSELEELCTEADKYGIKVIVDIVVNHLANNGTDGGTYSYLNSNVESDLKNANYYHTSNVRTNDNSRYNITQYHLGMPDLNTANSYIQARVYDLLKSCVDVGVDGFRFDAAKHIELPNDPSNCRSNFWPNTVGAINNYKSDVFCYGEILGGAGTDISNYTQYMAVTDNYTGDRALDKAYWNSASELADSTYHKGGGASDSVLWVESHDTYMGNAGSSYFSNTKSVTDEVLTKAWAIVGSRADSTSLYFARPNSKMGNASTDTTWKSKAVAEVNKFKNFYNGKSEYLSSSGSTAYNERGNSGVVISKLDGAGSVSLTANRMRNGTYTDQISGNTFTVSNGKISGTVGSTGVAVVYNPAEKTEKRTIRFVNTLGWSEPVKVHYWGGSEESTWPGIVMEFEKTNSNGYAVYKADVPDDSACVIFNSGNNQTVDVTYNNSVTGWKTLTSTNGGHYYVETYTESTETTEPVETRTVRFINTLGWSTPIYIHYWGGTSATTWPGAQMTFEKNTSEGAIYTADVPVDSTGIIFNNGSGSGKFQTVDLTYNNSVTGWKALSTTDSSSHYYAQTYTESQETTDPTESTQATTTVEPTTTEEPTTTAEPTTTQAPTTTAQQLTDGFYLVGSINGDNSWNPERHLDLKFSVNPANNSEYMLLGANLYAGDRFKVVYVANKSITDWYPGGTNNDYNITTSGRYDIYFRPDGQGGSDWHEGYFYVQRVGNIQPTTTPATTTEPPTTTEEPTTTEPPTTTEEPTTTEAPTTTEEPTTTAQLLASGYYLVGNIKGDNSWSPLSHTDLKLTENPAVQGEYMLTGVELNAGDAVKIVKWNGTTIETWYPSGGDNDYNITEDGEYDIYFRPEGSDNINWHESFFYVAKVVEEEPTTTEPPTTTEEPTTTEPPTTTEEPTTTEAPTTTEEPTTTAEPTTTQAPTTTAQQLTDGFYLVGSINGDNSWNPERHLDLKFSVNPANSSEYMLLGANLYAGDRFKVVDVSNKNIITWYPGGTNNDYNITTSGRYDIYFRPDGQGGSDWHEGYFYVQKVGNIQPTTTPATTTEPPTTTAEPTTTEEPTTAEPTPEPEKSTVYISAPKSLTNSKDFYCQTWYDTNDRHWVKGEVKDNGFIEFKDVYTKLIFIRINEGDEPDLFSGDMSNTYTVSDNNLFVLSSCNLGFIEGHWTKLVDYTILYKYSGEKNISITKNATAAADCDAEQLANINVPEIIDSNLEFSIDNVEKNGDTITVNLKAKTKKFKVYLNGEKVDEYEFLEKATVTSDTETTFLLDSNPVHRGKSFSFYVTGNMDVTTDDNAEITDNALLSLCSFTRGETRLYLEMLATVTTDSFKRMGVAFARSEADEQVLAEAIRNVQSGTAQSNNIAVHNSLVSEPNVSGQYQFRYSPNMKLSNAKGYLYFYTFCETESGEIILSPCLEQNLEAITG